MRQNRYWSLKKDDGELTGLSGLADDLTSEVDSGVLETYSEGASEDFLCDCEEEWNRLVIKA